MPEIARVTNVVRTGNPRIIAHFSLEMPSGAVLNHCFIQYNKRERSYSIFPPVGVLTGEDGRALLDEDGHIKLRQAISFKSSKIRKHFEETALAALHNQYPELFSIQ